LAQTLAHTYIHKAGP